MFDFYCTNLCDTKLDVHFPSFLASLISYHKYHLCSLARCTHSIGLKVSIKSETVGIGRIKPNDGRPIKDKVEPKLMVKSLTWCGYLRLWVLCETKMSINKWYDISETILTTDDDSTFSSSFVSDFFPSFACQVNRMLNQISELFCAVGLNQEINETRNSSINIVIWMWIDVRGIFSQPWLQIQFQFHWTIFPNNICRRFR